MLWSACKFVAFRFALHLDVLVLYSVDTALTAKPELLVWSCDALNPNS